MMCARLLCFLMKKRPETDVLGRFRVLNLQILDFQGLLRRGRVANQTF